MINKFCTMAGCRNYICTDDDIYTCPEHHVDDIPQNGPNVDVFVTTDQLVELIKHMIGYGSEFDDELKDAVCKELIRRISVENKIK